MPSYKITVVVLCALASSVPAQTKPSDQTEPSDFAALSRSFWKAHAKHRPGEASALDSYLPRFESGAREHAGTGRAVPYLMWIATRMQMANGSAASKHVHAIRRAVSTLKEDHIRSQQLATVCAEIGFVRHHLGDRVTEKFLDAAIKMNSQAVVQSNALLTRGTLYLCQPLDIGQRTTARAALRRAIELGKAPADLPAASTEKLVRNSAAATRALFEVEHLQVGMLAPDIEGRDIDGIPIKLSDYRGKVVALVFWFDP